MDKTHTSGSSTIERYTLYGESHQETDEDFVHIEDIKSRSRLHNWVISPHTHRRMLQLIFMEKGGTEAWVDGTTHRLKGPAAITIPSEVVHAFSFEPETEGWVLTISELVLIDARYRRSRKLLDPLFDQPHLLDFSAAPRERTAISATLTTLAEEFQWPELGRSFMFEWMIRIILMNLRRRLAEQAQGKAASSEHRMIFNRFRQLLEDHYRDHQPVSFYLDHLSVSQSRLTRICKQFSGRSALELIQDRLILEAQRHLIYTAATVAMIGYELGFQDPAYFSRFFKKRLGQTPGQYRTTQLAQPFPHQV